MVNVAERTLGAITSCWKDGGQPYWQIQRQFWSSFDATDAVAEDHDLVDEAPRQAWCTETIAYWHATADIPYWDGFYVEDWHESKFVTNTREMRTWYKEAEEEGYRGRWISGGELDYVNFEPGVNGPCPGAYQQLEGYIPCGDLWCWTGQGIAHSQLIDSMIVYRDIGGTVRQIDVLIIDGNSGRAWAGFAGAGQQLDRDGELFNAAWVTTTWYPDVVRYTILDDEFIGSFKIRGWGIDLDEHGDPICDGSRITTEWGPFFRGTPVPLASDEEDSTILAKFQAYLSKTGGNKAVSTNSTMVQTGGTLPNDSGLSWVIPEGTHPIGGPIEIDVDLLADHPYPVRGLVVEWRYGIMPPTWEIWWSPENVQIRTKALAAESLFTPHTGIMSFPFAVHFDPPTPTLPDTGYTLRYAKLRLPNPAPAQYEIIGFHYLFYTGDEEDEGSVFLETEPGCHCGSTLDPHGDVTRDGSITAADIIANVNIVFKSALQHPDTPTCPKNRSDMNCDGAITAADIIGQVNYVFKSGLPPCDPCA